MKGLLLGTAAVALLIYAALGTLRYTVLALAPTAIGLSWSAGILALAGVELDLFSMFATVTCIGIAVDYGLHVLHRYREEGAANVPEALNRTGAALLIACATTLVGFGTMINSSYPPLRVFGIVSVVTLLCCFITSVFLLPAILLQTER
jgi:predicted RND superfamily exporter protein